MTYDFRSLSSLDFEFLVRDLLQAEWCINIESFKTGRDQGIDLRYSLSPKDNLIIQCKHYSKFANLIHDLKSEKDKVDRLKPSRYVLATSLKCTPKQKDDIRDIFLPYCQSTTNDVFSAEDLNNLLKKHPKIEQQNFKLWLTSASVLDRVLHSEVFAKSETEIANIKQKIHTYVQNRGFFTAQEILGKYHYCIVSGIPGIGKTTLAEILLIHYLNQDFEVIKVSNDIEEAYKVFRETKKQIFYYDDFLGQTALIEKLNKNEDQRILQFMQMCENSHTSLFVLTTREYILNQAKLNYEKIANSDLDIGKCIIDLSSYTKRAKAKILFNHLYYSKLPTSFLETLIKNKTYKAIIEHKNYSPRIIEWMTTKHLSTMLTEEQYLQQFIQNLNNPTRIWEHAYNEQISNASKYVLLCLATMPSIVFLENLEKSFQSYFDPSCIYQPLEIHRLFQKALKELDGNFIAIQKQKDKSYVYFHNPSIRDFIEGYILENAKEMEFLFTNCCYFDQLYALNNLAKKNSLLMKPFIEALLSKFDTQNCRVIAYNFSGIDSKSIYSMSIEEKLLFLVQCKNSEAEVIKLMRAIEEKVCFNIKNNTISSGDLLPLLRAIKASKFEDIFFDLIKKSKNYFLCRLYDIDSYNDAVIYSKIFNNLTPKQKEYLKNKLMTDIRGITSDLIDSVNEDDEDDTTFLEDQISELKNVSDYLDVDISWELTDLDDLLQDLKNHIPSNINDHEIRTDDEIKDDDILDIDMDSMFQLLLDISTDQK